METGIGAIVGIIRGDHFAAKSSRQKRKARGAVAPRAFLISGRKLTLLLPMHGAALFRASRSIA